MIIFHFSFKFLSIYKLRHLYLKPLENYSWKIKMNVFNESLKYWRHRNNTVYWKVIISSTSIIYLKRQIDLNSWRFQISIQMHILTDYNKLVRPVSMINETLVVRFKLKLSQLLDVVSFPFLQEYYFSK